MSDNELTAAINRRLSASWTRGYVQGVARGAAMVLRSGAPLDESERARLASALEEAAKMMEEAEKEGA